MTNEQQEFEMQQAETLMGGGNKRSGQIVETKSGLVGRTFSHEELINGKIRVYTSKGNILCSPSTLKLKGFID